MAGAVFDGRAAAESNITVTGGAFNLCLMADGRIAFSTGCLGTSTYGYRAFPFCLCRSTYCRTIAACRLCIVTKSNGTGTAGSRHIPQRGRAVAGRCSSHGNC